MKFILLHRSKEKSKRLDPNPVLSMHMRPLRNSEFHFPLEREDQVNYRLGSGGEVVQKTIMFLSGEATIKTQINQVCEFLLAVLTYQGKPNSIFLKAKYAFCVLEF